MQSGCTGILFFFWGNSGLGCRVVSCAFACLPVLCLFRFVLLQKNQVIIFQPAEENMGEKKTDGDANQVDEERNRGASTFLFINPLKINTSRFDCIASRWG